MTHSTWPTWHTGQAQPALGEDKARGEYGSGQFGWWRVGEWVDRGFHSKKQSA